MGVQSIGGCLVDIQGHLRDVVVAIFMFGSVIIIDMYLHCLRRFLQLVQLLIGDRSPPLILEISDELVHSSIHYQNGSWWGAH